MTFPIVEVELDQENIEQDEQGAIVRHPDGTVEVLDGPPAAEIEPEGADVHDANLALYIDEGDLTRIAEELIEAYEHDKEARQPWERKLERGMEIIGYVDPPENDDNPLKGAARVVYPLIAEAITQFNARALEELFPASGPVKTIVVGDKTPEREAQARRVEEYMNYQITEEDPSWQDEDDRMLAVLPFAGHAWKKVYHDERLGIRTSKFVPAEDVFVPYSATSTHSLPRLCHRFKMRPNDVRFEQRIGNWLDVKLAPPPGADEVDRDGVELVVEEADGTQPTGSEHDRVHTILEFHVDYDLPGFEHVDEETGDPTGFALPYIITIEYDSRKVLKILRNWRKGDERFRKRNCMIAYRFLPGLGFYGFGFLHVIGGLNEAATSALRALLDSAARDNWGGGFMSNDVAMKLKGEPLHLAMGEWRQVDASAEDLAKGFYTPPQPRPSEALFKALGFLAEAGRSYTSTTEAMTGTAKTTGPVGTMVQLIEQGSKVFSGIHKRLHKAKRDEYRLLAELNHIHIPAEGYPYDRGTRTIMANDFGPEVDVLPVSDPNIYSNHQRIAMSQAVLDLSNLEPTMYNKKAVHRRLLEALKVPAPEEVLIDDEVPRLDPVSENMLILNGKPVKALPDQAHEAHIQVHMAFMQHTGYGGNPEVQKLIGPVMAAHLAEHAAYLYQQRMMEAAQIPYLGIDVSQPAGAENELAPQLENELAVRAAMASEAFLQSSGGLPPPPPDPAQVAAQQEAERAQAEMAMEQERNAAELQLKQADLALRQAESEANIAAKQAEMALRQAEREAEEARKARAFDAEEQRKTAEFWNAERRKDAEQRRKDEEAAAEQRRLDEAHAAEMERRKEEAKQAMELAKKAAAQAAPEARAEAMKRTAAQKPHPASKKDAGK